jgi:hypothetical protein
MDTRMDPAVLGPGTSDGPPRRDRPSRPDPGLPSAGAGPAHPPTGGPAGQSAQGPKRERLLALVPDGDTRPLAEIAAEIAPKIRLNTDTARRYLRQAAAQGSEGR